MLARYTVLHELGRGATGAVYAARDRETGAVVALKRLDPALSSKSDASFAERFLKHARSARLLKHPNIVRILDAGEAGGTLYVAMEMLEGQNLRGILDAGPVPIARAVGIARDIAGALAHAHLQGVVHGAIRPSNVIILPSGEVKLTDFGIGQLGQAALLSGARAGCVSYLAPEQVRGGAVDHRCDIFSLGTLLYEMLARRAPFGGGSPQEIAAQILHAKPPPPSELNPHVPRALDAMVFSMLAGEPSARLPGMPIVLRDLQRVEEALGLGVASVATAVKDEPATSVPPAKSEVEPRDRLPDREAFDYQKAMAMMEREFRRERSAGSRSSMFAALALVLAVFSTGLAGFMYYSSATSERDVVAEAPRSPVSPPVVEASPPPAPPLVPEAAREPAAPPVAEVPKEPATIPEPVPVATTDASLSRVAEQPASTVSAPKQEAPRAEQATAKAPERQPAAGMARLIVAVSPRGEIYVDGEHRGTTPPLTTLDLEPGIRRIEVRNGSRRPYLTYMTVQAGDVRRIRHDFDAPRAVPPSRTASWEGRHRSAR